MTPTGNNPSTVPSLPMHPGVTSPGVWYGYYQGAHHKSRVVTCQTSKDGYMTLIQRKDP